jgi:homoserine O-acetyltransferase
MTISPPSLRVDPQDLEPRIAPRACVARPLSRDINAPIPASFELDTGERLPDLHVRVRRFGRLDGSPILVMGGISSGRNLAGPDGWWSELAAPGAPIDLNKYCALGVDFAPLTDARVAMTPAAQARLIALVLDHLGIAKLHAIVGASYGGMVGLTFAAQAPERLEKLCVISASHKPAALALAWRGVQRRIVEFAIENGKPLEGLALARQLAMITYRSGDEFEQRFTRTPGADGRTDLDHYLVSRGQAYGEVMPARRWLSLSESIDRIAIDPTQVRAPTTLVACPTDQLVPLADMGELAKALPNLVAFHSLPSLFGHDAFLKEGERLGGFVRAFLGDDND